MMSAVELFLEVAFQVKVQHTKKILLSRNARIEAIFGSFLIYHHELLQLPRVQAINKFLKNKSKMWDTSPYPQCPQVANGVNILLSGGDCIDGIFNERKDSSKYLRKNITCQTQAYKK